MRQPDKITELEKNLQHGFSLFSTLLSLAILALLFVSIQSNYTHSSLVHAKLRVLHVPQLGKFNSLERLAFLALSKRFAKSDVSNLEHPSFDGEPFELSVHGQSHEVSLQDPRGLIDVNLVNDQLLLRLMNGTKEPCLNSAVQDIMGARATQEITAIYFESRMEAFCDPEVLEHYSIFSVDSGSGKLNVDSIPLGLLKNLSGRDATRQQMLKSIPRKFLERKQPERVFVRFPD